MTIKAWYGYCKESNEEVSIIRSERTFNDIVGFSKFYVGSITVTLEQHDNPHTATGHKVFQKIQHYSSRPRNTSDILPLCFMDNDFNSRVDKFIRMGFKVTESITD